MELIGLMLCGEMRLPLPFYGGRVPAGFPSPAEDYLETQLDLNDYLVRNKAATFLMRVEGDSMKGAGILHGDLIVVDRAAEAVSGSIVVVSINGEHTVKRLRLTPECVWLDADNPLFRSIRVERDAELHVFGVVKHAIHTLR
jgi:DNA polymerase V